MGLALTSSDFSNDKSNTKLFANTCDDTFVHLVHVWFLSVVGMTLLLLPVANGGLQLQY